MKGLNIPNVGKYIESLSGVIAVVISPIRPFNLLRPVYESRAMGNTELAVSSLPLSAHKYVKPVRLAFNSRPLGPH